MSLKGMQPMTTIGKEPPHCGLGRTSQGERPCLPFPLVSWNEYLVQSPREEPQSRQCLVFKTQPTQKFTEILGTVGDSSCPLPSQPPFHAISGRVAGLTQRHKKPRVCLWKPSLFFLILPPSFLPMVLFHSIPLDEMQSSGTLQSSQY